jgi:hypothetical protein
MATYLEVTQVLGVAAACYPGFKLEKRTIDAYAELLADLPADVLTAAAKQAMAESRFFPTIAELRERAHAMRMSALGLPDAYSAWDEVMHEVRRVGYQAWTETRWSHQAVEDIARRFWRDCCLMNTDDLGTLRAQFRDAYNATVARAERESRQLPSTNEAIRRILGGTAAALAAGRRVDQQ